MDINGIDRDARKLHSITYKRDWKNLLMIAYILIAKKDKYHILPISITLQILDIIRIFIISFSILLPTNIMKRQNLPTSAMDTYNKMDKSVLNSQHFLRLHSFKTVTNSLQIVNQY